MSHVSKPQTLTLPAHTEIIVFSHDKWRVWRRYMENDTCCHYNLFALFAIIFQLSFYGTGMFHPLETQILSKVKCYIWFFFFGYLYTNPNIGVHSARKDISVFIPKMEALVCGRHPDIPFLAWLVGEVWSRWLQALRQHFMLVCHRGHFWLWLCDETGTQLEFDPLHLIVMQVLLNQVAFSFKPSLHIWRDVWDHPRHEELHHEDHVLRRNNYHMVNI